MDLLKKEGCAVAYIYADAHSLKALEFYESFGFRRLTAEPYVHRKIR